MMSNQIFKTCLVILAVFCIQSCFVLKKNATQESSNMKVVRFASFNVSLNRSMPGDLIDDLSSFDNLQAKQVAEIIQRQSPDILALLEFDFDKDGKAIELFQNNYLNISQNGASIIHFEYSYLVNSNTGVIAEVDINGDGKVSIPGDAYGFGFFPGQYSYILFSKYEILYGHIRTFQHFIWQDMPGAMLPQKINGSSFYSDEVMAVFRLSSKNHIDIPIKIDENNIVHAIVAHPTPPVFDGVEDRNGCRNHDEIRFLNDYINNENYIYDDEKNLGGLTKGEKFVIMGDMNADPFDGESTNKPIRFFESNELINEEALTGKKIPSSIGGIAYSKSQGKNNLIQKGKSEFDTADFGDESPNPGNLRVDYVLPSANLNILNSGVFWPLESDSISSLNNASDHKLIWIDISFK